MYSTALIGAFLPHGNFVTTLGDESRTAICLNIGLLWHSARSGNLGVGALTLGNLSLVRSVARSEGFDPKFTILSMRDSDTDPIVSDDIVIRTIDTRAMLDPRKFLSWIAPLDCVLDIGAGDSFADIYGWRRFAFMWLSKIETVARGIPLVLSPQTIGPFTKPVYRRLAIVAMNKAYAVISRDDMSLKIAQEMAPQARHKLSCDVAFVMPYTDNSHLRGGEKLRVGVNVSGLLMQQAINGHSTFGLSYNYAAFSRKLIEALLARGDVEVHLVPHATNKLIAADDDARWTDVLAAEYPQVVRVPDFAGPMEAKSYISGLDFLVAGRMHACIGAFSAGTPVVPIAYSRKFIGLFGMLRYDRVAPVVGHDEDSLVEFVLTGLDDREILREQVERGMEQVNHRLDEYRQVLRDLFRSIRERTSIGCSEVEAG